MSKKIVDEYGFEVRVGDQAIATYVRDGNLYLCLGEVVAVGEDGEVMIKEEDDELSRVFWAKDISVQQPDPPDDRGVMED
jgi:hypothetical protein